jgi:hypothetical protein
MISAMGLTMIALFVFAADGDADFLTRVESAKQMDSQGKAIPRVERDPEGKVIRLSLHRMELSADDIAAIGRIKTLRYLDVSRTNITNADLRKLCESPSLEGINLCSTEVTDESIDSLLKLPALRSLCLGDVAITPGAVVRLKEHFKKQDKRLALGYAQRK